MTENSTLYLCTAIVDAIEAAAEIKRILTAAQMEAEGWFTLTPATVGGEV